MILRLFVALNILAVTGMGAARADVAEDEKALLTACIDDGGSEQRCGCYLGVIKAEAGADNYERAIALALAGATNDPREVVEVRRRFDLSEQDMTILVRTMQTAAAQAAQICEPLPRPGGGRD